MSMQQYTVIKERGKEEEWEFAKKRRSVVIEFPNLQSKLEFHAPFFSMNLPVAPLKSSNLKKKLFSYFLGANF